MIEHTVVQGECLSSLAEQYGFPDWRTIWNDAANTDLRQKRPDPNLLYPGDVVSIPDPERREESAGTEQRHRFRTCGDGTVLRLIVKDDRDEPLASKRYRLRIEGAEHEGLTDDQGLIDVAIPPDAQRGELVVWMSDDSDDVGHPWKLAIGALDPVDQTSGVQARLDNLGHACGPVDGIEGPRTKAAVRAFQKKQNLVVDGICGPQTRAKLRDVHGS